ncbi:MAG: DUF6338 family protein [Acidobacteriota bacterium]|jgi:hypothetical protein
MPTTATAVLILLIAVLPGLMGNRIYEVLVGVHWREKDWRTLVRLLGFSVVGVTLYALFANRLGLQPPIHLFPQTYEGMSPRGLMRAFAPHAGHLAGGVVAGLIGSFGARSLGRIASSSAFPSAWDDFARTYAPHHWVTVSLSNGSVYAGKLKNADVAVAADERDLVLEEPCEFDEETGEYRAINYQYLFIASPTVYSIAAIYEPSRAAESPPGTASASASASEGRPVRSRRRAGSRVIPPASPAVAGSRASGRARP